MNTLQTFKLCEPVGDQPIPLGTLAYFRARNRSHIHDVVLSEFKRSGLTQADLARRLRKPPEVICRWLGAPGNWGIDTASDLLFAISGGEAKCTVFHPLRQPPRNFDGPDWARTGTTPVASATKATLEVSSGQSTAAVWFEYR